MGGQSKGETMGFGILARVGSGVNPDAMHAERVDGYNPLAVADAVERKREVLVEGQGPVLLDTVTYRFSRDIRLRMPPPIATNPRWTSGSARMP